MKVQVRLQARATLEWRNYGGLQAAVLETADIDQFPHVTVYLDSKEDEWIEGSVTEVFAQLQDLITRKAQTEFILDQVNNAISLMLEQPIPRVELDADELRAETERVRQNRKAWLIEQIEDGSYAAIGMLKEEFGDTVKLTVELVGP